jgi:anti-anti-sigma factor
LATSQLSSSELGTHVVTLSGDWGLDGSRHNEQRLAAALEAGGANVVVDLRDVTFIDWGLIRALARAVRSARARNREFVVVKPSSPACRVFELAGMEAVSAMPDHVQVEEASADQASLLAGVRSLRGELEAVGRRARETRIKLAQGEATTGATCIVDIENRCRDALAALEESVPDLEEKSCAS